MSILTTTNHKEISIPQINALHLEATNLSNEARAKANSAVQMALLIGLKLSALKVATPHGQWENLFKTGMKRVGKPNDAHVQHLEFSNDTARRYIALATELATRRLSPEEAQALHEIAHRQQLEDSDRQFLDSITPVETLRQLYLEMGIIKPTKREAMHLEAPPVTEPEKPKKKLTLAEQHNLKKAEAREFWFGTTKEGRVNRGSIISAFEAELHNPVSGRLHLLAEDDLAVMQDYLTRLLAQIKTHMSEK